MIGKEPARRFYAPGEIIRVRRIKRVYRFAYHIFEYLNMLTVIYYHAQCVGALSKIPV